MMFIERALAAARAAHDGDVVAPLDDEVDPSRARTSVAPVSYTFVTARARRRHRRGPSTAPPQRPRPPPPPIPAPPMAPPPPKAPPRLPVVPVPPVAVVAIWRTRTSPAGDAARHLARAVALHADLHGRDLLRPLTSLRTVDVRPVVVIAWFGTTRRRCGSRRPRPHRRSCPSARRPAAARRRRSPRTITTLLVTVEVSATVGDLGRWPSPTARPGR